MTLIKVGDAEIEQLLVTTNELAGRYPSVAANRLTRKVTR